MKNKSTITKISLLIIFLVVGYLVISKTNFSNLKLPAKELQGAVSQALYSEPLLQSNNLGYLGGCRVPEGESGLWAFTADSVGIWPAHNSVFMETYGGLTAELALCSTFINSNNLSDLNHMTTLQAPVDILRGQLQTASFDNTAADFGCSSGIGIGHAVVVNSSLLVNALCQYDSSSRQRYTHFLTGLNFSNLPPVHPAYQVGSNPNVLGSVTVSGGGNYQSGFVGQTLVPIPQEWQAALGGDMLTGQCCNSIISRTSQGPSLSVMNTGDLGVTIPAPFTPVIAYPNGHPTLGAWTGRGTDLYTKATVISGAVWPEGTRSILFFGRKGTAGNACYGLGTTDPINSWPNRSVPDGGGGEMCYDLAISTHGEFAYPYTYFVWAYDANDLILAKNGTLKPWEVLPYATWSFNLPFETPAKQLGTFGYDPVTQNIYLMQAYPDLVGCCSFDPVVHAFHVDPGGNFIPPPPPPPPAPVTPTPVTPTPVTPTPVTPTPVTPTPVTPIPAPGPNGLIGTWNFDSNSDGSYISLGDQNQLEGLTAMTACAKIKPTSIDYVNTIAVKGTNSSDYVWFWGIGTGYSGHSFQMRNVGAVTTTTTITPNVFQHLCVTWDGSTFKSYKDGSLTGTNAGSGTMASNATPLEIGRYQGTSGSFKGIINDLRIYNRALSPQEIANIANPNPVTLAGDLDGNGIVNSLDWSIMSSVWFTSNAQADLNHDGIVNSIDFSILNRNWFRSN